MAGPPYIPLWFGQKVKNLSRTDRKSNSETGGEERPAMGPGACLSGIINIKHRSWNNCPTVKRE